MVSETKSSSVIIHPELEETLALLYVKKKYYLIKWDPKVRFGEWRHPLG